MKYDGKTRSELVTMHGVNSISQLVSRFVLYEYARLKANQHWCSHRAVLPLLC